MPHLLDIWAHKKVMSIKWDDYGRAHMIRFCSGEWEAALVEIAASVANENHAT
jgi:hypothetical protein